MHKREYFVPALENYEVTDEILDSFDVDTIELEAILWQTGYLTIKDKIQETFGIKYTLEVPNMEIQTSLNSLLITFMTSQRGEKIGIQSSIFSMLDQGNLEGLKDVLISLFASIPYHNFTNNKIANYEGYYASVIYAYLASLGHDIIAEDTTNKSRIDLTLKLKNKVYIFEFKIIDKPTGNALRQIHDRKYYQKYSTCDNIYLVGIEFSQKERNIIHFEWERLNDNPRLLVFPHRYTADHCQFGKNPLGDEAIE